MAFPTSPTNGQISSINGVRYSYSTTNNAWTRVPIVRFTTATSAPTTPYAGDQWYDSSVGVLYNYINNGVSNVWAQIYSAGNTVISATTPSTSSVTGALVVPGGVGVAGNVYTGGSVFVTSTTVSTSTSTGALVVSGGAAFNGNIYTSGWIIPSANLTQNLGTTTAWWNVVYGKSVQAQYADLAENYTSDRYYGPGTVVVFGGSQEVTTTTESHDTRVAGVVSTDPAYLMNAVNGNCAIALTGRVPCLVQGPVDKGTMLVTSDVPGIAQALNPALYQPGCVIGKSIQTITSNNIETIEVAVGRF